MPQVFGADQTGLMSQASMWSQAAHLVGDPQYNDLFSQFAEQEGFDRDTPFDRAQQAAAKNRLTYTKDLTQDLGPKTIGDKPPKFDRDTGQLLNGNGHHEFVIHLDPRVREGALESKVAGPRRYELSYHHLDRNGKLNPMTYWTGNTVHGLNNAHERLKAGMSKMRATP